MVNDARGFTLLEVMIAMAIMVVSFASILMIQSNALDSAGKARQMNVVSMLAKGLMVETEYAVEGKTFEEFKKEEAGQFKDPYQEYTWKREIKEIKFPNINVGANPGAAEGNASAESGTTEATEKITKLMTQHLSKAIREIVVTITWKRGKGTQSFTLSSYWVNLNHEFSISE
jgi:general secretion pathway protein I